MSLMAACSRLVLCCPSLMNNIDAVLFMSFRVSSCEHIADFNTYWNQTLLTFPLSSRIVRIALYRSRLSGKFEASGDKDAAKDATSKCWTAASAAADSLRLLIDLDMVCYFPPEMWVQVSKACSHHAHTKLQVYRARHYNLGVLHTTLLDDWHTWESRKAKAGPLSDGSEGALE